MTPLPTLVTFTGADSKTDVRLVERLSRRYEIEWAVLFSPSREGAYPRYPTEQEISALLFSGVRVAAHLCGDYAQEIMDGGIPFIGFPWETFHRVQVNHRQPDIEQVLRFATETDSRVVLQSRANEFPAGGFGFVDYLYDRSGGRGSSPGHWPAHPGYWVGYAGGLGPGRMRPFLDALRTPPASDGAEYPYWVDMESGVRINDWLDLDLCERVCEEIYGY